ncbi:TIM barrel protein [Streptomyces nogalater]
MSEPWVSTYFTIGDKDRTVENFKRQLEFLGKVGGRDIVVAEFGMSSHLQPIPVFKHRPEFTDKEWGLLTGGLNVIGELAAGKNMRLCYHHHMGTGVQTAEDIDRLMAGTDPNYVHLLLDTGHLRFAGDDPLTAVERHKQRIKHVHLKNVRQPVVDKVKSDHLSFQGESWQASSPCPETQQARSTSSPSSRRWGKPATRDGWSSRPNSTRRRRTR